jgi:hypothetical protein
VFRRRPTHRSVPRSALALFTERQVDSARTEQRSRFAIRRNQLLIFLYLIIPCRLSCRCVSASLVHANTFFCFVFGLLFFWKVSRCCRKLFNCYPRACKLSDPILGERRTDRRPIGIHVCIPVWSRWGERETRRQTDLLLAPLDSEHPPWRHAKHVMELTEKRRVCVCRSFLLLLFVSPLTSLLPLA